MPDQSPEGIAALVAKLRQAAATPINIDAGETWIDEWAREKFQAAAEALMKLEQERDDAREERDDNHSANLDLLAQVARLTGELAHVSRSLAWQQDERKKAEEALVAAQAETAMLRAQLRAAGDRPFLSGKDTTS